MEPYTEHEDFDGAHEMAASVRRSSRKRKRPALYPSSSSSHTEEEPVDDVTRAFNPTRPIPTPLARSEPQVHIRVEEDEEDRPGTTTSLQIEDDTSTSMSVESHGNEQVEEKNKAAHEGGEGDEEKNNTCGICLEEVKERGVLDSCRHAFCFDCIHRWSKVANSCPMCKAAFYTITRQHDVAGAPPQEEKEEVEVEQDNPPSKRRRGRKATSQKKKPKKKPDVVRVRPKKQQYRYSRREIEDIARAAEAAEASQSHHHHHPGHRYASASLLNRMLGHPDADVLPATSMGFFFGLADPADNDEDEDEDLDEDEMESLRSGEEGEDEDDDFLSFASGRQDRARQLLASTLRRRAPYQPPRQRQPTAAPHHWESQAADRQLAGARDRIRSVLESRARMRVDGGRLGPFARNGGRAPWMAPTTASVHHPPPTGGGGAADFHRQQHQQAMAQGLESLKGMFGDSMDAEVLEAVLQQVGGSVERAVDALFAMQGGSGDSPVASSEDSSTSTSTSSATAAAVVDLTAESTPAASSPPLFEWSPPTHSTGATARPSRAPAPAWSSPSSPPETSMSAPIILVPDEDIEFIAERQVKPRGRHLGLQRTATASSSPADGADYNRPRPSPSSASSATSSPSPSPSSPLGSGRRFPKFPVRRFCPPRPLSSFTSSSASSSPSSSSSAPLLPLALPPLVSDDADRRPDVGHEEGMTLAWRDFAEVQRETKKEHKRKQLEEREQQSSRPAAASASASSSPPSSGGRPPLPSGLTRRR